MFNFNISDIKQVSRSAAKFLNPEEEAELRKKELQNLGQKTPSTSAGVSASEETHVCSGSVTERPTPTPCPIPVSTPEVTNIPSGVKNKVLASANPDMIAKLSSMFASPTFAKNTSVTPSSVFSPPNFISQGKSSTNQNDQSTNKTPVASLSSVFSPPAAPTSIKSKFLARYSKPTELSSTPSIDPSGTAACKPAAEVTPVRSPMMGFLAQIKARGPVE